MSRVIVAAAGVIALVVATTACGGGGAGAEDARSVRRRTTRIALLPPVWVAGGSALPVDARGSLTRGLEAEGGVSVRATEETAMGERTAAECADDLACVREMGGRARAEKAVVTRLAELGDTVVVRVSLVDVRGGT